MARPQIPALNLNVDSSWFSMKTATTYMHNRYSQWEQGNVGNFELALDALIWKVAAIAFTCFYAIGAAVCGSLSLVFSPCGPEETAEFFAGHAKDCFQGFQESLTQLFLRVMPEDGDVQVELP